ncbi:hypothetical protein [Streptomyces sp. IBSBF 3136]
MPPEVWLEADEDLLDIYERLRATLAAVGLALAGRAGARLSSALRGLR